MEKETNEKGGMEEGGKEAWKKIQVRRERKEAWTMGERKMGNGRWRKGRMDEEGKKGYRSSGSGTLLGYGWVK